MSSPSAVFREEFDQPQPVPSQATAPPKSHAQSNGVVVTDGLTIDLSNLEPIEVLVKYKGKEFVLREAREGPSARYQDAITRAMRVNDQGKPVGIDGTGDAAIELVASCLFERYKVKGPGGIEETKERPTTFQQMKEWPHRAFKPVLDKCKEISNLRDDEGITIEQLRKRIESDTKRLKELEGGDDIPKKSEQPPDDTSDTSDSQES